VLDAIRRHRPTFTVGAITAFIALLNTPGCAREDFASFRYVYSGGAPIAPSVAEAFEKAAGLPVHNAYGLTETTSPMTATPRGVAGPVDTTSGALSVGVPVNNTLVRILDALPMTVTGKILRRVLRDQAAHK